MRTKPFKGDTWCHADDHGDHQDEIMVVDDHKDEHPHFYDNHLNEIIPNLEILEAFLFRCG